MLLIRKMNFCTNSYFNVKCNQVLSCINNTQHCFKKRMRELKRCYCSSGKKEDGNNDSVVSKREQAFFQKGDGGPTFVSKRNSTSIKSHGFLYFCSGRNNPSESQGGELRQIQEILSESPSKDQRATDGSRVCCFTSLERTASPKSSPPGGNLQRLLCHAETRLAGIEVGCRLRSTHFSRENQVCHLLAD